MADNKSVRLSEDFWEFLKKIIKNRVKLDIGDEVASRTYAADLVVKYFKDNNDEYLKMIGGKKDV